MFARVVQFVAPVVQLDAMIDLLRALLTHPGVIVGTSLVPALYPVDAIPAALIVRRNPSRNVRNDMKHTV